MPEMSEEMPAHQDADLRSITMHAYDISLKVRILRQWRQVSRARAPEYTEREILILELVDHFSPVTEGELRSIFGLSASSVSETVKKLADVGLLNKFARDESDQRVKPLSLLPKGKVALTAIRESAAIRYNYLFSELGVKQLAGLRSLLKDIDKVATREVRRRVFNEYA